MALYPITTSPTSPGSNAYNIPNGNLYAFPFTLGAGQAFDVTLTLTTGEDWSLQAWISDAAGNGPIVLSPIDVSTWRATRTGTYIVTVCDSSISAPAGKDHVLALTPGNYYVNVLNLSNGQNAFVYVLTQVV